jgi:hypothetical protein
MVSLLGSGFGFGSSSRGRRGHSERGIYKKGEKSVRNRKRSKEKKRRMGDTIYGHTPDKEFKSRPIFFHFACDGQPIKRRAWFYSL